MTPARVRQIRVRLGLSQADLASILGCHSLTVSRWERGVLTPSAHSEALLTAFAKSDALFPSVGPHAERALRTAGVSAALYILLRPGQA